MDTRKTCVYNRTRECFLGLEVAVADSPDEEPRGLLDKLALKSGEGLWIKPSKEIPSTGVLVPVDLVYLDEECHVLDVVESFPTARANPERGPAASVLALPTHAIYSSQTQPGDQLVICVAEEMERRLERFSNSNGSPGIVQSAVLLREKPLWSGGPGVLQLEDRSMDERANPQPPHEMNLVQPGMTNVKPPKSWLERWWSPDPRKAPREQSPRLAAYYWTGGAPKSHNIRDISATGLYLLTEERWYPGTLVLMTLQRTDDGEELAERSISVQSRAVRWGTDGVGLQFILPKTQDPRQDGVDKKTLDRFLQGLKKGNA
jgi:uncharacterized membrane protein (UPF0127 family)